MTLFWHDNLSDKGPLKSYTPEPYRSATTKQRSVMKGLQDDNWIRAIAGMHTPSQLYEFANLWTSLARTNLDPDRDDIISWKWTSSGVYSSASDCALQFHGPHLKFLSSKIYSAHAEPKCKFFSCIVLHGRILTADVLAIRVWPHALETAVHLCKDCPFSQAV